MFTEHADLSKSPLKNRQLLGSDAKTKSKFQKFSLFFVSVLICVQLGDFKKNISSRLKVDVAEVRRMNISGDCSGLLPLLCKAITVTR